MDDMGNSFGGLFNILETIIVAIFVSVIIAKNFFTKLDISTRTYVLGTIAIFILGFIFCLADMKINGLYSYTYLDIIACFFMGLSVGGFIYFPCFWGRKTDQFRRIWRLCLLAGWTGIGWFIAIIWADSAAKALENKET